MQVPGMCSVGGALGVALAGGEEGFVRGTDKSTLFLCCKDIKTVSPWAPRTASWVFPSSSPSHLGNPGLPQPLSTPSSGDAHAQQCFLPPQKAEDAAPGKTTSRSLD